MIYMIEVQVHYVMKVIEYIDRHRIFSIEVKPNVHDAYNLQL